MSSGAEILTGLTLVVVGWLVVELVRHRRALNRIPVRIHVNGTRGKSSVARLLAAGLRPSGKRVLAKTTGTLARVILPNQRELSVYRPLGANIREQVRIVGFAAEVGAEILVIECMALQPVLQWLSERMFVRASHGVITNARPDHLDVMGPTGVDVAKALCGMMPVKATCFTAERDHLNLIQTAAEDRGSALVTVGPEDVGAITDADMAGFGYHEHRENVALALSVCASLGVDREQALEGMWGGQADPGALTFDEIEFFGRRIVFVNAFAANDPVSSQQIWEMCIARYPEHRALAVFNCRSDRADRSRQLGACLPAWTPPDGVLTVGNGTVFFARAASKAGFDVSTLENAEGLDARDVFERLIELSDEATLMVGLGNIGGLGLGLVRLFRNRSVPGATTPPPRQERAAP
ncbi:MAG: poly-gamma-glutamate synthase PgsB [Sandaracinaceae bacterium]